MNKNKKKLIICFLFAGIFLASANFAYALEIQYPSILGFSVDNNSTLPEYAKYFFNIGMAIAGTLAALVIVFGGIYYLISFGRGKFTTEAKDWIKAGILGLLLILCSYLIAYTINPYLVIFDLKGLAPLNFLVNYFNPPGPQPPVQIYSEIPIGKLTENLLARQIDCYDFNADGDPIPGDKITTDDKRLFSGPTYLEHDRVDCILKLSQAAEKKAQIIKNLSDKIVGLMQKCTCQESTCDPKCDKNKGCIVSGTGCAGPCKDGDCKPIVNLECCPKNSGIFDPKTKKELAVRQVIEQGPITVDSCDSSIDRPITPEGKAWFTSYGHMKNITVATGQKVNRGTLLGQLSNIRTDMVSHLHFDVGFENTGWTGIGHSAIDFDFSSKISAPSVILDNPPRYPLQLPQYVTSAYKSYVLKNLAVPLNINHCNWKNLIGSWEHTKEAYYAQDWACPLETQSNLAYVYVMSGGTDITSTVIAVDPAIGGVVIKHELREDLLLKLLDSNTSNNSISLCKERAKDYAGLDEFRSKFSQNYSLIKNTVEVQPQPKLNKKEITIINLGNCTACNYVCEECDPNDRNYSACIKNQEDCKKRAKICEEDLQNCLKNSSPWHNLALIDQLIYLQGRIEEIKEKIKADSDNLKEAESFLGQCYIADTYVDFLKTFEDTDKKNKIIMIDKPFYESPSKYCKGFEYNNSTCYSQCKDICPGTDKVDFDCYKKASTIEDVKACYDYRSCQSGFNSFNTCITTCKQQCANTCEKYSTDEKEDCLKNCNNNSQCLLDNADKCLVDFNQLKKCADASSCRATCNGEQTCMENCQAQHEDINFVKNCVENSAYLCTYCSDQYAGYPECLKSPYSLQDKYSSSFIYQHIDYQICTKAYELITTANSDDTKTSTACLNLYPETAKCPASSKCPECPCDTVNETIDYFNSPVNQPGTSCTTSGGGSGGGSNTCQTTDPSAPGYCAGGGSCVNGICISPGTSTGSTSSISASVSSVATTKTINEYKICSGNCDDYSYNDDPLTFYCQNSWWNKDETKNTIPIGHDRICPKEREIPIGKTIDDAEKWADDLITNIDKVTKKIKDMIQYMQRIGQQKDYCKCDSKCEDGEKICHTDCSEGTQETTGSDGSATIETTCSFVPCSGSPCQLMIDLLLGVDCKDACGKGKGMDYYRNEIDSGVKDFIIFTIQQNRSDIVKELEYSRQKINDCSVVQNNYGVQTKTLSCTRAQDEIISPIVDKHNKTIIGDKSFTSYCYGKSLGKILQNPEPLADNWFCCEDRKKEE